MQELVLSHPAISKLRVLGGEIDHAEDNNIDVILDLKDGRSFGFTVFTLANVARLMGDNSSFVSPGMLIVCRLTQDALIEAVTEAVRLGVEQFGVLQR